MTDAETRAELERIKKDFLGIWDDTVVLGQIPDCYELGKALRLLAESQQALREIREIADKREPDTGEEGKVLDEIINLTIKEE